LRQLGNCEDLTGREAAFFTQLLDQETGFTDV
jgi:hypothetical protein